MSHDGVVCICHSSRSITGSGGVTRPGSGVLGSKTILIQVTGWVEIGVRLSEMGKKGVSNVQHNHVSVSAVTEHSTPKDMYLLSSCLYYKVPFSLFSV